jgi:uncharacterized protein YbjT (DUF2867 family)
MRKVMTILVIGARGHIGGAVLTELLAAGETVRASSRNPKPDDFPDGVEVVRADLTDPETFPELLNGVRKVFLYANSDQAVTFAAEARKAGVEHIVLLSSNSVLFPGALDNPTAVEHMKVEQALTESGVDFTFVRPGYLATNTFRWQPSIRTDRTVRTAFPVGSTPLVHERDVAGVAARALLDDAHRGQAYLVLGGATLTEREQVEAISHALGEPVRLDVLDVDAYRQELLARLPEVFVEPIIRAGGQVPQVPQDVRVDAVPDVLGRPPRTFAEWARDHVADFR